MTLYAWSRPSTTSSQAGKPVTDTRIQLSLHGLKQRFFTSSSPSSILSPSSQTQSAAHNSRGTVTPLRIDTTSSTTSTNSTTSTVSSANTNRSSTATRQAAVKPSWYDMPPYVSIEEYISLHGGSDE